MFMLTAKINISFVELSAHLQIFIYNQEEEEKTREICFNENRTKNLGLEKNAAISNRVNRVAMRKKNGVVKYNINLLLLFDSALVYATRTESKKKSLCKR